MIALLFAAGTALLPNHLPVRPDTVCNERHALQASTADPAALLRPQDRAAGKFSRLGDLPRANKEVAVMRSVSGCTVPVAIRYEVEGDGRFAAGGDAR